VLVIEPCDRDVPGEPTLFDAVAKDVQGHRSP
jgi:hypothetical protein